MNTELSSLLKQEKNIVSHEEECEKILEKITECLLSKENAEENFNLFCEYQIMEKIVSLTKYHLKNINIIIIKNLGLLIPSLQTKKILFYFFSNDYMNQLILNISASIEERDIDFLSYHINFLKTIANKLDINTLSLFFHKEYNSFPLLDEASAFFTFNDIMIKNTARNIFLSIIKLNYEPMIQYICDIPRITDLLLLADNIKSYLIYLTTINISNNINISDVESKIKEVEENLVDDILFIQDILSLGIIKINYILINCLFSIPFQYLFNCILNKNRVNISFYILNLLLKHIKDETVNNLIAFVLCSSQIHNQINEYISNKENQEIYNILYLNKYLSHHSGCFNLLFDEYIILVYNQKFLKSIRYLKEEDKLFEEIKEISNYIKERSDEANKDVNLCNKIISEKLRKNDKLEQVIKKMEVYHNLISRITGINLGISRNEANFSFLKIIYDNFLYYNNNDGTKNNINIIIQDNKIKKECLSLMDCNKNNSIENHYILLNQLFLLLHIINSNKISLELKRFMNINKPINEDKNKIKFENEHHDKGIGNKIVLDNKLFLRNLRMKNGFGFDENDSSISGKKRNDLIKDFFGISETKTDYDILNNYFTNSLYEESNLNNNIGIIMIPKPVNNKLNDDIINFKNFVFNNKNLNKLFTKYNSKKQEEKTDLNLKLHDELLQKIIDIIFNNNKLLCRIIYRLSFELIENLILGMENANYYTEKYKNIFMNKYTQILNEINAILLNSNSTKTKIYKFAYQYFEESYILNKKKFQTLLNESIINHFSYLLLNIKKDKGYFDIIDNPKKEHENLQCLFQILIGLCDLKNMFGFNNENEKYKFLFRNVEFPLQLINSNLDKGKIINIKELNIKVSPVPVIYKSKDIDFKNFFIFNYQNYLFIVSPLNKKGEENQSFLIDYSIPLRQIIAYADRGEPRTLYLLNTNHIETTLFFEGVQEALNMKETINNAIKLTNLKEFSEVKSFINDLMGNYLLI